MEHKERIEESIKEKVTQGVTKSVKVIFFIILGIGLAFFVGYILMLLWNWLMPELFGLPALGYWQAIGLLLLAKIIFGFGGGNGPGGSKNPKSKAHSKKCRSLRKDFSDWKYYDEFWNKEGEQAFQNYIARKTIENGTNGE